jgi:hypothetical protein
MGAQLRHITGQDDQGRVVTIDMTTVEPDLPPMLVGLNIAPPEYGQHAHAFPGVGVARVFGAPGKGVPAWTSAAMMGLPAGAIPHVSFKDWPSMPASMLLPWLDAIPADRRVWLTYHHEPEGDMDPGLYRSRWAQLREIADGHHARPRVTLVSIQTLYPARRKALGAWRDWWAPAADVMGWDCYSETTFDCYEPAPSLLGLPAAAAAEAGVRWMVPELGAVRATWDTDGRARAAWIAECVAYLRAHGCEAVSWWCAAGSNGKSYHLDDPASAAAWRDVIAGR